ncbi:toprim domain-containing protein, partial [Endobacter medicaginis]
VLAAAQTEYRRRLDTAEGAPAREYLRRRGLSEGTIAGFGLGWSGDGRGGLVALLEKAGFSRQMIAGSGLMRLGEDGSVRGELFFNRVTFPIHDRRGVLTSFGGRLLGDGQPKYLNGPETALFSKRRTLFGLDRALAALRAPRPPGVRPPALLVVEGYMDVIALHQAGLVAVAPLGTALTSEQIELLWRAAAVPVLCFD